MPDRGKTVHLVGICGSGMSSLALWYAARGYTVTGCDRNPGDNIAELERNSIGVLEGHDPSHVAGCSMVVFSAAVPPDHAEITAAREADIPVLRRSEALAELANGTRLIAVAGAHGKTTTTAMTGWILQEVGSDPTVMLGGSVTPWGGNFRAGGAGSGRELSVVEADEYDRTFLRLRPAVSAVTTYGVDHLECYGTPEALSMAFGIFLEMTRPGGSVVVPRINLDLARWACRIGREVTTTGPGGDLHCVQEGVSGWGQDYTVRGIRGRLPVPGEHNLRNAETAIAIAGAVGVAIEDSVEALATFPGVARRLERIGELGDMILLSDYAHHPDEIRSALEAVRAMEPGEICVVFQPHLFSRTASQADEMGLALSLADRTVVLPIYPAREEPMPGVSSRLVSDACRRAGGHVFDCEPGDLQELLSRVGSQVVVFMGAGSVDSMGRRIADGTR